MKTTKLLVLIIFLVLSCFILCSCWVLDVKEFLTPEGPPSNKEIAKSYHLTELNKSSAADILPLIHMPEHALLSQSTKVLASQGAKKKGYKIWMSMFTFDEDDLLVKRKYLFIVDEKRKVLFTEPRAGLRLDCQMLLESEILEEPYSNENARRIAILENVRENTSKDIKEVAEDNKMIAVSGAMINQALQKVLVDLDSSPAKAKRLSDSAGLEFSHTSFDKGKIQMVEEGGIATIKIRLGSLVKTFEEVEDVNYPDQNEMQ